MSTNSQEEIEKRDKIIWYMRIRQLRDYPIETLSEESLIKPNETGETLLHCAAIYECLGSIPTPILTKKNLLLRDSQGKSVLAYAANHDILNTLPDGIINEELLLTAYSKDSLEEDKLENSVLCAIVQFNQLDQILGIPLSEKCERLVSAEWLEKNNAAIKAKNTLTSPAPEEHDIEVF